MDRQFGWRSGARQGRNRKIFLSNYVLFTDVTGSSFTLDAPPGGNEGIVGFQIVDNAVATPEPSISALFLIGAERVPEDVGLVHLSLDDDVLDWAGIHSNKREIGATAAGWVISMVQNHRFGVPAASLTTLVRGSWQHGKTLRIPNVEPRAVKRKETVS